ncbi:Uncharacterized protein OS=Nostoc sp. (strain ATCC 29411 / PCC 7524) GN=Nos7524_2975 PE=4 SV=1 [Gemmata massiliana]|uniref:Uncharacterized protein n=1 Tax=Gemmata massiliana TaxID=1210884 RepID=A0A6P2DK44_9BACT|nr:Uncharacterized protein OS=Nostoc sp. (strain ATCC 29411 / PCC 7524) GN=Nos7524_2975 PE=4 SV=1 [Gemmata massiliana]
MRASAWRGGSTNNSTYGIRVGRPNRDEFFSSNWDKIEVEIDGAFHSFALTGGFWRKCPEFRDRGEPILREWLRRNHTLDWQKGTPPTVELVPLGGNRFRLTA